ncbi:HU family DNA-binding protein [Paramagnetospirillum caucaseum]|uniref:HU family DNA-binding protein n=1 Tax=Paramagnetospirillum caucaseum TaxID=1244869 RepID=UPI001F376919|nr:HU family DNA-binding protein [Paramagnetospirillum caucaseum]
MLVKVPPSRRCCPPSSTGVKADGSFRLAGFGSFSKSERAPKTGEAIEIAATIAIRFSAAAALKTAL